MKFSPTLLSLLVCFSLATPHKAQAVNPMDIALAQIAAGAVGTLCIIDLLRGLTIHFNQSDEKVLVISPQFAIALVAAGSVATATCLVSGYQALKNS